MPANSRNSAPLDVFPAPGQPITVMLGPDEPISEALRVLFLKDDVTGAYVYDNVTLCDSAGESYVVMSRPEGV